MKSTTDVTKIVPNEPMTMFRIRAESLPEAVSKLL